MSKISHGRDPEHDGSKAAFTITTNQVMRLERQSQGSERRLQQPGRQMRLSDSKSAYFDKRRQEFDKTASINIDRDDILPILAQETTFLLQG